MSLETAYDLHTKIHEGVSAVIYRARRRSDGQPVVVKALRGTYPSEGSVAQLKHEFEILSGLEAPGVIRAYALETEGHSWAMILEDIGGASLERAVGDINLSLGDRLRLAIAIIEAIGQVHAEDVIHKNINPSNVVWNPETNQLKLIDFRIATRLVRENPARLRAHVPEGTLAYMSPEQTGRTSSTVDYRADLYSFGVTLYELLTGRRPFPDADALQMIHSQIAQRPTPPHAISSLVPRPVSDVVMKLLEKTPEERYQSDYGLQHDLELCLEVLNDPERERTFHLAGQDISRRFRIPQRLYGRETEVQDLVGAFGRVCPEVGNEDRDRKSEIMIVSGPAGIGKSALLGTLHGAVSARNGYFISGKFEELRRTIPYSALVQAFQSLVEELLTLPEEGLEDWRRRLGRALGSSGRVLTDVLPQLELIVGPQAPVQELGPVEAGNRFDGVLHRFIQVFAQPEHPLVLFLDDLQWADPGSLRLVKLLMTDESRDSLMLVGAYRDSEVDATHPLSNALSELRAEGVEIREIRLKPLAEADVRNLVADTLASSVDEVEPLAELIARNTEGNPLFVTELLTAIHDDGLIRFDRAQRRWQWDVTQIEERGFTENVLELMVQKLDRLPEATRRSLRVAASIGSRFDPQLLSVLERLSARETVESLLPAIDSGVILTTSAYGMLLSDDATLSSSCSFFHDRLRQAAYGMLDERERAATHLEIGRLLERDLSESARSEQLFVVVDQLNLGRGLISDPAETLRLVRLNLQAGLSARASTAFTAAAAYLRQALELLPPDSWKRHYDLTLDCFTELAVAENLTGEHERSRALTETAFEHARTNLEKAEIENIVVRHHTMSARYQEALEGVRRGLGLLGRRLPSDDLGAAVQAEFDEIQAAMGDTPVGDLADRPTMTDPEVCAAVQLLQSGFAAAFYIDPVLYSLMIFRSVNLSLRHGHPPEAKDLYAFYGHLLTGLFNRPREGYEFGRLAVTLSDKAGNLQDKCRSSFILANFIHAWVEPLPAARAINDAGYEAGTESGELQFAGYILFYKSLNDFFCGKPLSTLLDETREYLAFHHKVRDTVSRDSTGGLMLVLSNISGANPDRRVFETDTMDEGTYVADCQAHQTTIALCYYNVLKAQVLGLHGDHEQALRASEAAEALLDSIMGNVAVAEHAYHTALSLAAVYPGKPEGEREALWARLEDYSGKLSSWADSCPANFAHMDALVRAEMARCRDDVAVAVEAFEDAVELARKTGFGQDLARANELAGRFWLSRGRERLGRAYLGEAYLGYRAWEATHKLRALEAEYSWIGAPAGDDPVERDQSGHVDLASVIKASQAISGEIVLERLLRQLMRLMVENAGAERGVLVVDADPTLQVEATAAVVSVDGGPELDIQVLQAIPLPTYDQISHGVVDYVARTADSVILDDALSEGPFTRDAYILKARPRSVLCIPLSGHGRMVGCLYLENSLVTGAFTPRHLEVLRLLSSQFVISFENARLYEDMERKVMARTEELSQKNKDIEEALRNLRSTQDQLIHSEKMASLGQLTAGVAHEINNPLNFVNNFARLGSQIVEELADSGRRDPDLRVAQVGDALEDLKANVESIEKHSRRATAIVASMLQHARGSRGERELVDLNAFVREYIELAKFGAGSTGEETRVSVSLRFDDSAGSVHIQRQEFGQVLVNLLNNAFDAVRERQRKETGAFEGEVEVSTHRKDDWVEVRVADNGTGVPDGIRDKIFQPFFTTKPGKEGTGLGLSLCYEILVQGHAGRLTLESPPGGGSVFIAGLPAANSASRTGQT